MMEEADNTGDTMPDEVPEALWDPWEEVGSEDVQHLPPEYVWMEWDCEAEEELTCTDDWKEWNYEEEGNGQASLEVQDETTRNPGGIAQQEVVQVKETYDRKMGCFLAGGSLQIHWAATFNFHCTVSHCNSEQLMK